MSQFRWSSRRSLAIAVKAGCFLAALLPCRAFSLEGGVNISGLEMNPGTLPGRPNWDYAVPTQAELAYYHGKGINLIRLPIEWERLQPAMLSGNPALDGAYLQLIETILQQAGRLKMGVVIDVHNNGQYYQHWLGGGVLTDKDFADFWRRVANHLHGRRGLAGYDLMNEPENMPSASAWPLAAQAAVTAIREADARTTIYVEGDNWASAQTWPQYNGTLAIDDPDENLIYEAHAYGDRDGSGTHFIWSQEVQYGVTVNTIAERIQPFSSWCSTMQVKCMLGEIGVGNDDPDWNVELANGLAFAAGAGLKSFTYWAGGLWWGSYPMSIEPRNGIDAVQMAVVQPYGENWIMAQLMP